MSDKPTSTSAIRYLLMELAKPTPSQIGLWTIQIIEPPDNYIDILLKFVLRKTGQNISKIPLHGEMKENLDKVVSGNKHLIRVPKESTELPELLVLLRCYDFMLTAVPDSFAKESLEWVKYRNNVFKEDRVKNLL